MHQLARVVRQVLIFSTMTRALDIIEEHLEWRGLASVRLDGATAADERGSVRMACART
jgi:SNF2 family DNA or RNA helicase